MSKTIAYNQTCHVVIDIETFGTNLDAPIIEIGAVIVCPNQKRKLEIIGSWSTAVDVEEQINNFNCRVDGKTLMWWMKRGDVLKEIANSKPMSITHALDDLSAIIDKLREQYPTIYFWSRGTDFDYGIIKARMNDCKLNPFWNYWELRDIRTISNPLLIEEKDETQNNHHAVDDAVNEATELVTIVNNLVDRSMEIADNQVDISVGLTA